MCQFIYVKYTQFKQNFNNTSYFLEAVSVRHIVIDTGARSSGRKVEVRAGMAKTQKGNVHE